MSISLFVGGLAFGAVGGVAAVTAAAIARRAEREYRELRRGIPLLNSIQDLEYELGKLQRQQVDLKATVQRYEEMEQRLPGLERAVSDLESKRAELAPLEEQHKQLEMQISGARLDLDRLASDRAALEQQLATAKAEVSRERQLADEQRALAAFAKGEADLARQQRDAMQAEAKQLQYQISEFEVRIRETQSEIAKLSAQETGIRATIEQHERQLREVQEQIVEFKAKVAAAESRVRELEKQADELRAVAAKAAAELRKIETEIAAALARKEAMLAEIERLRQEIEKLEAEKARKAAEVKDVVQQLQGMQAKSVGGVFSLMDAAEDLFTPYLETERDEAKARSEEQAIKAVKAHAMSLGFQYPDRVIRSFHTSLKLGRNAPLLVLAGISGTGKSQLPRLYCDALGINFLPMAVQPGWDSPADLVGFFSHIEHRFKPTQMARALAQMDRFLPEYMEQLKQDEYDRFEDMYVPRHDQMLLVLLDEMNLARVEYYFSDFLSRLELRNAAGFDSDNPEHRRRVELMFEAPGASDYLKHVAIFPGDNVLFVGTMNEDESTMALSDKVLDRANVLRFGRPQKLQAQTKDAESEDVGYLSIDTWREWTQTTQAVAGNAAKVKAVTALTARLNDSLDLIQRAFAHRTAAAIQAYCLAYPMGQGGGDATKIAFADQIEQRVMPKLRGVDPSTGAGQQAFDEISGMIDDLGDSDLADAVRRGREANDGQSFVWYGVSRKADV